MSELETTVYDTIDDVSRNQWDNLVTQSDRDSLFHTTDWLSVVESALPYRPRHVVVAKDGNPVGVFPNFVVEIPVVPFSRLVSIPVGGGGPVIGGDESRILPRMLEAVAGICTGRTVVHRLTTQDLTYIRYGRPLEEAGYRAELGHCRFVVDLSESWDAIEAAMTSDRRTHLSKALEQDFRVTERPLTPETIRSFHRTYRTAMDRVGGTVHPASFFRTLADSLADRVTIFTAFVDGDPVGSHLYVSDSEAVHHLFSAVEADDFDKYPSELIHRHAIQWARMEGFSTYDFGSTPAEFDDGTFEYKSQYGGQAVPNLVWQKPYSRVGWTSLQLARYLHARVGDLRA